MGLRDVLNGMMNGPGGQRQPSTGRNTKGVPRIIWALLGLLAYKAFKGDDGEPPLQSKTRILRHAGGYKETEERCRCCSRPRVLTAEQ